jgi:hypothetical protein
MIEMVTLSFGKLLMETRNNERLETGSMLAVFLDCTRNIRVLDPLQLMMNQYPVEGCGPSAFHGCYLIALSMSSE